MCVCMCGRLVHKHNHSVYISWNTASHMLSIGVKEVENGSPPGLGLAPFPVSLV